MWGGGRGGLGSYMNVYNDSSIQTVAINMETKFMYLKIVFPPLLQQFLNDCTHMYKSLVFGDEFVSRLKSHQRCSAAFCRPVKFFHTD